MFNRSEVLEVIADFRAGKADDRVIDILLEYIELTNVKQEEEVKIEQKENFVSGSLVFPHHNYRSPWVDCSGYLKYGFKFVTRDLHDKATNKYYVRVEWSNDGLNPIAEEEKPSSYVKARYARLGYKNIDSQPHNLDIAIILFS